jgi:selenide,water dikinase
VLGDLPVSTDPRVLIDYRTADDAGVYRLDEHRALVQTVDFFTPIVDDPAAYGRIAAANALSDVYAMGGTPLTALAIAAFPKDADPAVVSQIFRGGLTALTEAGVALLGGHTVQDQEIKFGYAVTGLVDPRRVWSNAGARAGDVLLLTKPLGTGVIATAMKFGRASEPVAAAAVQSMSRLNREAAAALAASAGDDIHACTDVTGFGLAGHAVEMALGSGATLSLALDDVPLLAGALELVEANTPGGGRSNATHFGRDVLVEDGLDPRRVQLAYDPQTSGGLLAAVAPASVDAARAALAAAGLTAAVVGTVGPRPSRSASARGGSEFDARRVALRLRRMV